MVRAIQTRVEIVFIRHMWSCANSIEDFGKWYDVWKRVIMRDPPGTDWSLGAMASARASKAFRRHFDLVVCSTMLRAQETALELFPNRLIYVVPWIKEKGWGNENRISEYPDDQRKWHTPANAARLDYSLVTDGGEWSPAASEVSYEKFLGLIAAICASKPRRSVRIAAVTHSNFMKNIFRTPDKPLNIGTGVKRYVLTRDVTARDVTARTTAHGPPRA